MQRFRGLKSMYVKKAAEQGQAGLVLLHFCDTFHALSRGKFKMISGMLQTWLIHNQIIKKESNIL